MSMMATASCLTPCMPRRFTRLSESKQASCAVLPAAEALPATGEADTVGSSSVRRELLNKLTSVMEKARRAGRPLIISRLPRDGTAASLQLQQKGGVGGGGCMIGKQELLAALAPIVRTFTTLKRLW